MVDPCPSNDTVLVECVCHEGITGFASDGVWAPPGARMACAAMVSSRSLSYSPRAAWLRQPRDRAIPCRRRRYDRYSIGDRV